MINAFNAIDDVVFTTCFMAFLFCIFTTKIT